MADPFERVSMMHVVPRSHPLMINEQSSQEVSSVSQSTSSTSNAFAYFQNQADMEIPSVQPLIIDIVGGGGTATPTSRDIVAVEEVCSSTDSEDEDNPTSESDQVRELPNLAAAALERLASRAQLLDESGDDDFRPLKKMRVQHAENDANSDNDNESEGQTCSICFEPWSNSGRHRICSLKCGHLFGYNCILKWLKGQADGRCPQCNAKAKTKEIRVIFAKSISAVDTTERDRAISDLEVERHERIKAQKSEAQTLIQYQLAKMECDRMKAELRHLRQQLDRSSDQYKSAESVQEASGDSNDTFPPTSTGREGRYDLAKSVSVSTSGGARVLAFDSSHEMLVASRPSSNHLIPGYGLMKISLVDVRGCEFVGIHSKIIRDVQFSPRGDGLTLTTGMDKTLKLTSMHSNAVVQSYLLPSPAWACCWDQDNTHLLYCGLSRGTILTFDLRNTSTHVTELRWPDGAGCPVTSLAYVPLCRAPPLNCSGLVMGSLDGCVFWETPAAGGSLIPHTLDTLAGPCTSVTFEPLTRHCLVSFRPTNRIPHCRHVVCHLQNTPIGSPVTCHTLHQFSGSSCHRILSRSKLFQRPAQEGQLLAAFGDQSSNLTHVWDVTTTTRLQQLHTEHEPCLDMATSTAVATPFLSLLTESKLYLYNWRQTTAI